MAVTIVALSFLLSVSLPTPFAASETHVAAPPKLKNTLASSNCGYTFFACTNSTNAKPTMV